MRYCDKLLLSQLLWHDPFLRRKQLFKEWSGSLLLEKQIDFLNKKVKELFWTCVFCIFIFKYRGLLRWHFIIFGYSLEKIALRYQIMRLQVKFLITLHYWGCDTTPQKKLYKIKFEENWVIFFSRFVLQPHCPHALLWSFYLYNLTNTEIFKHRMVINELIRKCLTNIQYAKNCSFLWNHFCSSFGYAGIFEWRELNCSSAW